MLVREVRDKLASISDGSIMKVEGLPTDCPGYLYRREGRYGAAIPFEAKAPIEEKFSNAILYTTRLSYNHKTFTAIAIECGSEAARHQFASLCAEFLEPGRNHENRNELLNDPRAWWKKWRDMLGNSVHDKQPYMILGEMLVLEHLLRNGINAKWTGPKGSTQDISSDLRNYEVKSTTTRYETRITVSSKFQLLTREKKLSLFFMRFEPFLGGDSLKKATERLVTLGYDRDEIIALLKRQGISVGNAAYIAEYRMLEMRDYIVDDNFPLIVDASFVGGHIPEHIVDFVYTVDLAGIPYSAIHDDTRSC